MYKSGMVASYTRSQSLTRPHDSPKKSTANPTYRKSIAPSDPVDIVLSLRVCARYPLLTCA